MFSLYRTWLGAVSGPDVILNVGSHQFAGHRHLLAAHSGYLKSLLLEAPPPITLMEVPPPPPPHVTVPNVSPEVFAPLLTFIYTGYLDLTPENIYGILLATHLLHMPRALDLCRSYLVHHHPPPPPPPPPPLIKPIPSHKMLPMLLPHPHYWASPHQLPPQELFSLPPCAPDRYLQPMRSPLAVASTSTSQPQPSTPPRSLPRSPPPSSLSPCLSYRSDSSGEVTVTLTDRPKPAQQDVDGKVVVVDVACCDGPVRFRRVLNRNYRHPNKADHSSASKAISKQLGNEKEKAVSEAEGQIFTCHFCDHTFKSHYCYQKHARRHINPVNLPHKVKAQRSRETHQAGGKRQVRLLDMNVQYYPCKTCGSKFPSYYFVHKHRKLCHPEEDNPIPSQQIETESSHSQAATV